MILYAFTVQSHGFSTVDSLQLIFDALYRVVPMYYSPHRQDYSADSPPR